MYCLFCQRGLVNHIALFADFIERNESTERGKSIVIVISPLNVLIKDHVTKLRETGLRACILKADRVASDCQDIEEVSISSSEELESLTNFQLFYAHPEALVESRQVLKLLKKKENFKIEFERLLWTRHILMWTGMYMY